MKILLEENSNRKFRRTDVTNIFRPLEKKKIYLDPLSKTEVQSLVQRQFARRFAARKPLGGKVHGFYQVH